MKTYKQLKEAISKETSDLHRYLGVKPGSIDKDQADKMLGIHKKNKEIFRNNLAHVDKIAAELRKKKEAQDSM